MIETMSYEMRNDPFQSEQLIKGLLAQALDVVFENAIIGNNNFLILRKDLIERFYSGCFSGRNMADRLFKR